MAWQTPQTFTPDTEFYDLETPRGPKLGSLSITALARFEFEAGKGNEGTKVLMIEWEDDDITRTSTDGSWQVSWAGKTTLLPASERPNAHTRRFYFLLPPHTTIPPNVTLSYEPTHSDDLDDTVSNSSKARETLTLNCLPAIFPPGLGATGRSAGKKGVLHTIWAKKRLRVLEDEIQNEALNNTEGVALHMAVQEKEWIETNFGVTAHGEDSSHDNSAANSLYPTGPATPVSPVTGRKLADKLKGLKLQTGERELSSNENSTANTEHLLSPQSPDVAVSSFGSFRTTTQRPVHSMPTPDTNPTTTPSWSINTPGQESFKAVRLFPPESLQDMQRNNNGGLAALSSMDSFNSMSSLARTSSTESGDDLFAKALSPRSPDLPRSPFSFN